MPPRLLWSIGLATVAHTTGYGLSFLLPLRASEVGGDEAFVGQVLAVAMVSGLAIGVFSGHLADRFGRARSIAASGLAQALAFFVAIALSAPDWRAVPLGIALGCGWVVFYLLTPIFAVGLARHEERVKYLTIVSGLMMLGIGLGPLLARGLFFLGLSVSAVFAVGAGLSLVSAAIFFALAGAERRNRTPAASLDLATIAGVLRSEVALPIAMIAIGGSIFGCLTNFQTSIAQARGVDFSLFFVVFVATVVVARLTLAGKINARSLYPAATVLLALMCLSLLSYALGPQGTLLFVVTTAVFGVGYGLTYSVLNAIVANIADRDLLQPALLVFPLAYLAGLYGFPFVGGWLIVAAGVDTLVMGLLLLGALELTLAVYGVRRRLQTNP